MFKSTSTASHDVFLEPVVVVVVVLVYFHVQKSRQENAALFRPPLPSWPSWPSRTFSVVTCESARLPLLASASLGCLCLGRRPQRSLGFFNVEASYVPVGDLSVGQNNSPGLRLRGYCSANCPARHTVPRHGTGAIREGKHLNSVACASCSSYISY